MTRSSTYGAASGFDDLTPLSTEPRCYGRPLFSPLPAYASSITNDSVHPRRVSGVGNIRRTARAATPT